ATRSTKNAAGVNVSFYELTLSDSPPPQRISFTYQETSGQADDVIQACRFEADISFPCLRNTKYEQVPLRYNIQYD
ncbi:hypothetical protein L9F63_000148, partial [Diploptera punctata]